MNYRKTLAAIIVSAAFSTMSVSNLALAEASDATKVDATELTSELKLHPMLGQYALSVVAMDDDTLSIEGMIDDQRAFDALNQLIDEKAENSDWEITNNVVNS